ncbi:DUF2283 domain-containing protein [Candidatus Pacearchaeota archaeon]|nr:DUF2283 domain-containing protein [Candidatus Pacearchaeota archaeon]
MEGKRCLEGKGEWDYDFKYDVLFFKVKNRKYLKSIEVDNFVLDLDSEKFLTGIQIFDASEFLKTDKIMLREIPNWRFEAKIENNKIEVRLMFQIKLRNKIIEKNPIIIQPIEQRLPNSQLICN